MGRLTSRHWGKAAHNLFPSTQEATGSSPACDTSQLGQEGACRPIPLWDGSWENVCPGTLPEERTLNTAPTMCTHLLVARGAGGLSHLSTCRRQHGESREAGVGRGLGGAEGPRGGGWGVACLSSTKASPQRPDLSSPETSEMDGLGWAGLLPGGVATHSLWPQRPVSQGGPAPTSHPKLCTERGHWGPLPSWGLPYSCLVGLSTKPFTGAHSAPSWHSPPTSSAGLPAAADAGQPALQGRGKNHRPPPRALPALQHWPSSHHAAPRWPLGPHSPLLCLESASERWGVGGSGSVARLGWSRTACARGWRSNSGTPASPCHLRAL